MTGVTRGQSPARIKPPPSRTAGRGRGRLAPARAAREQFGSPARPVLRPGFRTTAQISASGMGRAVFALAGQRIAQCVANPLLGGFGSVLRHDVPRVIDKSLWPTSNCRPFLPAKTGQADMSIVRVSFSQGRVSAPGQGARVSAVQAVLSMVRLLPLRCNNPTRFSRKSQKPRRLDASKGRRG